MIDKEIAKIKNLQDFTGGFSDFVLTQMQFLILAHFQDAKTVEIHISDDEMIFNLIPYSGIKGWWRKFVHGRKRKYNNNDNFVKHLNYWLPKTSQKRIIKLQWKE